MENTIKQTEGHEINELFKAVMMATEDPISSSNKNSLLIAARCVAKAHLDKPNIFNLLNKGASEKQLSHHLRCLIGGMNDVLRLMSKKDMSIELDFKEIIEGDLKPNIIRAKVLPSAVLEIEVKSIRKNVTHDY